MGKIEEDIFYYMILGSLAFLIHSLSKTLGIFNAKPKEGKPTWYYFWLWLTFVISVAGLSVSIYSPKLAINVTPVILCSCAFSFTSLNLIFSEDKERASHTFVIRILGILCLFFVLLNLKNTVVYRERERQIMKMKQDPDYNRTTRPDTLSWYYLKEDELEIQHEWVIDTML